MPEVILAGYNLDLQLINALRLILSIDNKELNQKELIAFIKRDLLDISADSVSPETLSAAYARISRSPKPVPELRRQALREVEQARKSNKSIIFGLGHSSVAEHAVFNFDILQVSRLAVEFIQRFRLASFTEKSQRYIRLDGDYVLPGELKNTPFENRFREMLDEQTALYEKLLGALTPYFTNRFPEMCEKKSTLRTLEGWAKEDARYALPLAATAQMGMTVNARTLELMIARAHSHPLEEIRELGTVLYENVKHIAPSIVKYPDATPYFSQLEQMPESVTSLDVHPPEYHEIKWLNSDSVTEDEVLEALAFTRLGKNMASASAADKGQLKKMATDFFKAMHAWDSLPREFEMLDLKFEVTLSASAYAQLKRHRMMTQLPQPYAPALGFTVPPSVKAVKLDDSLRKLADRSAALFEEIRLENPVAAPYVLMNGHRRRVLMKMNFRELMHFTRLRADEHAQWDIRLLAQEMEKTVRNKLPLLSILLGGKDSFEERKNTLK